MLKMVEGRRLLEALPGSEVSVVVVVVRDVPVALTNE